MSVDAGSGFEPDAACASMSAEAKPGEILPVDIIWAVDQSESMNLETQYVTAHINDFAQLIASSGIDYRVVMIASPNGPTNPVCVPAPLSNGSCGDAVRFKLVDQYVYSTNALEKIIARYPSYSGFLRPNAVKHFVIVTDDNSKLGATEFLQQLDALQPAGMFAKRHVHGIYAFGNPLNGCKGPFGTGAQYGAVYTELVNITGGAKGQICYDDWTKVFQEISDNVENSAKVPCEYTIPDPPTGTVDPDLVNVTYTPGGAGSPISLYRVHDASECGQGQAGGWYYDDPEHPTKVQFCPTTCQTVQADDQAKVDLVFGCASQFKPVK